MTRAGCNGAGCDSDPVRVLARHTSPSCSHGSVPASRTVPPWCHSPTAALLCLNEAREGGESQWASSWAGGQKLDAGEAGLARVPALCPWVQHALTGAVRTPPRAGAWSVWVIDEIKIPLPLPPIAFAVHNEFLKLRPDLGPIMTENWYFDRKGEVPEGKQPFFAIPAFNYFQVHYSSTPTVLMQKGGGEWEGWLVPRCSGVRPQNSTAAPLTGFYWISSSNFPALSEQELHECLSLLSFPRLHRAISL